MALILRSRKPAILDSVRTRQKLSPVRVATGPSPLEILAGSQRLSILEHADQELKELCSSIDSADKRRECFEVYDYYRDNRSKALSGCAQELEKDGKAGTACQSLDSLEQLVYQVAYTGDAETLYQTLRVQSNIAKRAASGSPLPPSNTLQRIGSQSAEELKTKAMQLFEDMDADGNGVIDREEFLNAMHMLHHALSDHEAELVFSCMDANGYLTPDQFVNIVQAERMSDPAADAEALRYTKHARPSWWTDAPHCVTDV